MNRNYHHRRIAALAGACLALVAATPSGAAAAIIFSDTGDGEITRQIQSPNALGTAGTATVSMVVGTSGSPPTTGFVRNAILFFELPAGLSGPAVDVTSASLSVTITTDPGTQGTLTNIHADLYGLGFQTGTTMNTNWFYSSNTADPGAGVGIATRPRIQDNFFNGNLADNVTVTTTGNTTNLATYLESLYVAGAQPGQYAVFRLNMEPDQSGASGTKRWFIHSGDASGADASRRPQLSMEAFLIPEPASLTLLALGGLLGLRRPKR